MSEKIHLFDVDGVLVQSEYFTVKYSQEFGVDLGAFEEFFENQFLECLIGKSDLKVEKNPWLKKWKWHASVEEFLNYWFEAENKINFHILGQIKILKENKLPLYLATNQEKYRVQYLNETMGLNTLFNKTFYSGDIGVVKPNSEFFSHIINDLQVSPSNIYFYDDILNNVQSAVNMGIKAIHYKPKMKIQ